MAPDPKRDLLRHITATLAYRGGKAVRNAPQGFAGFSAGKSARTPGKILAHMGDLLAWALSMAEGKQSWHDSTPLPWDQEAERFFAALKAFDDFLAGGQPLAAPAERLFQGPIADVLTHIGQIAILRRLADAPVKAENYFLSEITPGRVGPDQPAPLREF
jgi:hypothetical protein